MAQSSGTSHGRTLQTLSTLYQAKLARVLGDEASAEARLGQARSCYAEPDAAVRQMFGEEAVAQALRFDSSRASQLIDVLDQDHVGTQVLRVRLALVEHDDRAAAALLADLPPATTRRTRVERSVLWALSMLSQDAELAYSRLHEALDAGRPERLIRTVVDQAPDIHHLLASCTPDANQERYVEDLLDAASRLLPPTRAVVVPGLVERLSPREVMVLRQMCSRLSYRDIARGALRLDEHPQVPRAKRVSQARGRVARRRGRRRSTLRSDLIAAIVTTHGHDVGESCRLPASGRRSAAAPVLTAVDAVLRSGGRADDD